MRVKDIMTKDPVTAEIPDTRDNVVKLLIEKQMSGVPVVSRGTKKLVGIVTRTDIFNKANETQLAMIMNRNAITVKPNSDVKTVARLLYEGKIHRVPVVEGNKLVGICSPMDLLRIVVEKDAKMHVEKLMSKKCAPIYKEAPLPIVIETMKMSGHQALPVLDKRGELAGIVSDTDLFNHTKIEEGVSKSGMNSGDSDDAWSWEGYRDTLSIYYATSKVNLPQMPVKKIMIKNVVTVFSKSTASDAAKKMRKYNVGQLPVLDIEKHIVGMIYDLDLVQLLF
jgi:CBS domain-containing protein